MGSIGVDIIEVKRIQHVLDKNSRFIDRILTDYEKSYYSKKKKIRTLGGFFCSKEAVSKLLGTGIGKTSWKDIEVRHDEKGKPMINLYNEAKKNAKKNGIDNIVISISHSNDIIIAIAIGRKSNIAEKENIKILPKRETETHKGDYGKVGIVGGSIGMAGAPYLSSLASLRTGSGLVYTFVPKSIGLIMEIKSMENIVIPIPDSGTGSFIEELDQDIEEKLWKLDVLGVGIGVGKREETASFIGKLLENFKNPIVLDADGIDLIGQDKKSLEQRSGNTVITPHMYEFAKFLGISIEKAEENKSAYAIEAARKYKMVLVLKGNKTMVTNGTDVYINETGNPGMATAGSGDVLTGIITSLIGQGVDIFNAAKTGVYLHGLAGDLAAEKKGEYGLIASDIVSELPYAIKITTKE